MDYEKPKADSARIYIHTLSQGMSSYSGYRAGSYGMSSLKKMSGTTRFLQLPEDTIDCKLETFEECNTNLFIEQVQAQCGCVPWALSSALSLQVAPAVSKVFPLLPRTNFSVHPTPLPATQQSPKALQLVMSPALDSTQMWSSKRTQFLLMTK